MKKLLAVLFLLIMLGFLSGCVWVREPEPDYLAMMIDAAARADTEAGRLAAQARDAKIDESGAEETKISFDELLLLSRYITLRAGRERLSDELRLCTGEVVLNRVASPEFPDTLEEVLAQEGEYPETQTEAFRDELRPSPVCVDAALELLLGRRILGEQAVYQYEGRPRGAVCATFCDRWYTYTYFCLSEHPELYEGGA